MLEEAEAKKRRSRRYANVSFRPGDGLSLPLGDASVDAITIAFGLRNMADRRRALGEMQRVLRRPHGRLFVLEFSQPVRWLRPLYFFYLRRALPRLAGLITGDRAAYEYLGQTIGGFPDHVRLGRRTDRGRFLGRHRNQNEPGHCRAAQRRGVTGDSRRPGRSSAVEDVERGPGQASRGGRIPAGACRTAQIVAAAISMLDSHLRTCQPPPTPLPCAACPP